MANETEFRSLPHQETQQCWKECTNEQLAIEELDRVVTRLFTRLAP